MVNAVVMRQRAVAGAQTRPLPDPWLTGLALTLLLLGVIMVGSASVATAGRDIGDPFYFLKHQALYGGVGLIAGFIVYEIPLAWWERSRFALLVGAMALLALVLVPGIGHTVNGSMRWIELGPLGGQASEPARLLIFIYVAGYLVHRREEIQSFTGFLKPMIVLAGAALLLLMEPDFGAAAVMMGTALTMMFLGGVRLRHFIVLVLIVAAALALLAWSSPYRMDRLTAFLNPWADPFDDGFQLTQSLIAIGRGGWFGVGLGESVQKLFYLPEAHTDFLYAVLAEELGVAGAVAVIAVYLGITWRAFAIGRAAARRGHDFGAFIACGLGLWIGLEGFINIGVNMGVLPTKGLTLPLMSYGGSSLVVTVAAVAMILRVQREAEAVGRSASPRQRK
ncbi:MAG TPA: putative lipid II flippase FtsW [Gammaproteobacteria bacterium]|nr:putative lipid II flippase FtsW [Gammaproteobacteria bacterium]